MENHDASTSPKYAGERKLTSRRVSDDGEEYIVLIEREVVGKVNTWPGKPARRRWRDQRVTLSLPELEALAKKYIPRA